MDATKYPKKKRLGDGTSTRIVGTDGSFDALVPSGREVFVTLGPPDQELESPPGNDTRIIQWSYNEYRSVLTFTGQIGFSRVRLTPNSRAEFARLRVQARQRQGAGTDK